MQIDSGSDHQVLTSPEFLHEIEYDKLEFETANQGTLTTHFAGVFMFEMGGGNS